MSTTFSAPPGADRRRAASVAVLPLIGLRVEPLPAVAVGILILGIGLQLVLPAATETPQSASLAPRRPRPVQAPLEPEYDGILARPIFAPDRKPGAGAAGAAAGELAAYAALGAAVGHGVATAVISGPAGAVKSVRAGDLVEGWRVAGIGADRVTFERNGVHHTLMVGAPAEALAKAASGTAPDTDSQ